MNRKKILMVCLGNICRSPLAEGIMRHKAMEAGIEIEVDSAGTGGWQMGSPPHPLSQKVALLNNINISSLRARRFEPEDLERFDHIYFMDHSNLEDARQIAGKKWNPTKVSLLLDVLPGSESREVPDPFFGEFDGYLNVFDMLSEACHKIAIQLANFERTS